MSDPVRISETEIKLRIACLNLQRLVSNPDIVKRHLAKTNDFEAKWAHLAKRHSSK